MIMHFQFMQYSWLQSDDLLSSRSLVTFYDIFEQLYKKSTKIVVMYFCLQRI